MYGKDHLVYKPVRAFVWAGLGVGGEGFDIS